MESRTTLRPAERLLVTVSTLHGDHGARRGEPVTVGVPLPRAWCRSEERLILLADSRRVPVQTRALDRWRDGSIRWLLLDLQADAPPRAGNTYELARSDISVPRLPEMDVVVAGKSATIDTGVGRFTLDQGAGLRHESRPNTPAGAVTARLMIRSGGRALDLHPERVICEERGPLRTVLLVEGTVGGRGSQAVLLFMARCHFHAGSASVRVALTLRNPRRAQHRGGYWDLGDPGSVYVDDASVALELPQDSPPGSSHCSVEAGRPLERVVAPFVLYQDSSGGENWRSSNHLNRCREVPLSFRGYRLTSEAGDAHGLRATPVAALRIGNREIGLALRHFWQRFPKALEGTGHSLTLRLMPGQHADTHEIQGGEQITEFFVLAFAADTVADPVLDWVRNPLRGAAQASWYAAAKAVPYLVPAAEDPNREYVALVSQAVEGKHAFATKRETIDEYGWRHFGDLYADHEAVRHNGPAPLVSHYNNQYDAVAGLTCQFFRSGDLRWLEIADDLADHVIDVDVYHTLDDKPAYNRGLFWHTYHYTDADLAAHRTYPRRGGGAGGGPSAEHNYSTGLMLRYFLSGDGRARDTAVDLGRWVIDMDDGGLTPLRWIASVPTGLASATGTRDYHGPGRGSGNSIVVLLNAYRLTGERQFLSKAEALLRRCVHPSDDIAGLNLLDAERRWYYTVFFQAVGRYLDAKIEMGELDGMYAYGREALLHYARWMAAHEYPYLEKPEILEFPTETWVAQDMRKSEVFKYALKHAASGERETLAERAKFFFEYSVRTLCAMDSRGLTRPVVLLLSNGYMQAFFERAPGISAPAPIDPAAGFGSPGRFVPQRTVAMRRLIGGAFAALLGLGGWLAIRATG